MASSTQKSIYQNLTYNDEVKSDILMSGGTIVFIKDNVIVASEISEEEYRQLLLDPHIEKMDILPLKRYGDSGVSNPTNSEYTLTKNNIV